MAASVPPSPKLGKSTALNMAQSTSQRLSSLVPTLTTDLSPVTVYQPGVSGGVGNELLAKFTSVSATYGVWVAPDLNGNGTPYYVQVECFGGGGGGGGGNSSQGGGGGGGGEYACETQYPVVPGESYAYVVGLPGSGGFSNSLQVNPGAAATNGGPTVFDLAGLGLAGGVVANGGTGADQTAVGIGGGGGSGSVNSIHFSGGMGATNVSGNGSDNAIYLALTPGAFLNNILSDQVINVWYVLNDATTMGGQVNDSGTSSFNGTFTLYSGSITCGGTTAPSQVPAYSAVAGGGKPNAELTGAVIKWNIGTLSAACAKMTSVANDVVGPNWTVSTWIQPDPSGTWGNTAHNSYAVIAANTQNYISNSMKGYALYLNNQGTPSSPNWVMTAAVGDGTHNRAFINYNIGQTPNTWSYVVMTFNAGVLKLYVNNVLQGTVTASGYTSVPDGAYATTLGLDPHATANWFFGSIANFWTAADTALPALVSQAFGVTPATGGAGGGSSGGPSAIGGNGIPGAGSVGGAGGTPPAQPSSLASTTTAAQGGYAGSAAGASNGSPSAPSGGSYGGGGGGCGDMPANPTLKVLTIPFTAAATYCGEDAASTPGAQYNVGQMTNPGSNLNSVLFAGGLPADTASGSKNSIMLLPKGLAAQLAGSTIVDVFLTVTNAFPTNTVESVLEVGYSADTSLPQSYNGSSLVSYVAAVPIPVAAGTIKYDMTQSGIGTNLKNGTATALVIGPGSTPTFDAYNAVTGPQFYASIYGPGAADAFGNAEQPYLTIVYQPTVTVQQGSAGSGGAILITAVTNTNTAVAFVQPFAGTDAGGNAYAQGFTGQISGFQPNTSPTVVESWHSAAALLQNSWTNVAASPLEYKLGPDNRVYLQGRLVAGATVTGGPTTLFTLPSGYRPLRRVEPVCGVVGHNAPSPYASFAPVVLMDTGGNFNLYGSYNSGQGLEINTSFPIDG